MSRGKRSPKDKNPSKRTLEDLKQAPGRCSECAGYRFKLKYEDRQLIRVCTGCKARLKV
ncbi:hypothetical protein Mock2_61 [Paenibacillus phage Mock2]|uniref:DUF8096 domain-containing protein n=2 Tax=Harrisonvirus harrison TaxID=1982221 RepID=A0A0K2CYK2_9CAUD|nr:hypothetical protein HARRISON_70 [Paenibacillus phage Harrison]ALA12644.1 hypothetical protein PAISLEY_70 [Paenibacillus phage Paisley]QVV19463.1 hypothetical protein Bert_61 [Paenibacillus phage Bert]QVV19864.1 hypothetical protein Mock2_61 [Paenibacillus phage Mock2]UYL93253.1 hypothetical protein CALLAN_63 [Paenibacillus phage Callan]UYL93330.1 hypothetical protein DASH_65 [Paenibacillus phage Dash]